MSRGQVRVDAECDGCLKVDVAEADTLEEASAILDGRGWLRNVSRDQDLCRECFHGRTGFHVPRPLL